jgi:hypothetical protein
MGNSSQDLDFQRHMSWSFCIQWVQLRWKVIVRFVDISGIDDTLCLNFLFISSVSYIFLLIFSTSIFRWNIMVYHRLSVANMSHVNSTLPRLIFFILYQSIRNVGLSVYTFWWFFTFVIIELWDSIPWKIVCCKKNSMH